MNREELKYLIIKNLISQEIEKLKEQLYSKDQIKATCPNCGEKFLINQCRVVSDLQGRINKAIKFINKHKWNGSYEDDYDIYLCEGEINKLISILKGEENEK